MHFSLQLRKSRDLRGLTPIWTELYLEQQRLTPGVPLCKHFWVVANKKDVPRADWEVSLLQGDELSSKIGATFRYISARTGEGTEELVRDVAVCVVTASREVENGSAGARGHR